MEDFQVVVGNHPWHMSQKQKPRINTFILGYFLGSFHYDWITQFCTKKREKLNGDKTKTFLKESSWKSKDVKENISQRKRVKKFSFLTPFHLISLLRWHSLYTRLFIFILMETDAIFWDSIICSWCNYFGWKYERKVIYNKKP